MASFRSASVNGRRSAEVPSVAAAVAAVESAPAPLREPLPLIQAFIERRVRAVVVLPEFWPVLPSRIASMRSEEHTSELQYPSISYAVFCLKKKKKKLVLVAMYVA